MHMQHVELVCLYVRVYLVASHNTMQVQSAEKGVKLIHPSMQHLFEYI